MSEITIYDPFKAGIQQVATDLADFVGTHVAVLVAAVKNHELKPEEALAKIRPILRDRVVPIRTGIDKIRQRANEQYREQIKRNDAYAKELQAQHAKTELPIQAAVAEIEAVKAKTEAEEREAAEKKLKDEAEKKAEAERQRVAALEAEVATLRAAATPPATVNNAQTNVSGSCKFARSDGVRLNDGPEVLHAFAARLATFMEGHVPTLDDGPYRDILTNDVIPLMRRAYIILKNAK